MRFVYRIAYFAEDVSRFHGLPYLYCDSFSNIDSARIVKKELKELGFKGVEIFKYPHIPDKLTWSYVEENKVE